MKPASHAAAALLGLAFITFGTNFFFPFLPAQEAPPPGTPPALFMGALYPSGYLGFVKALEILGGLLTAIPRTRSLGLLVLGPIIVNILCFHSFLTGGVGLFSPPIIAIAGLAAFVLFTERKRFAALIA
jgi:hypothetical protein